MGEIACFAHFAYSFCLQASLVFVSRRTGKSEKRKSMIYSVINFFRDFAIGSNPIYVVSWEISSDKPDVALCSFSKKSLTNHLVHGRTRIRNVLSTFVYEGVV